ncbi:MAG: hypothetical protein M0Z67_06940 [Nitrospiraceae bacterium]|nr:hypothetical protein [Nitrospiraceae bacterium]
MEGFGDYLSSKAYIQDKYVPYYLKWVSHCYSFFEQPDSCLLSSERIESYLHHISKTREDWQVAQITPSDTAFPPPLKIRGGKGEL